MKGYVIVFGQRIKQYVGLHAPSYCLANARVIRYKKDAAKIAEEYLNGEVIAFDEAKTVLTNEARQHHGCYIVDPDCNRCVPFR